jgi:hypothetical protein
MPKYLLGCIANCHLLIANWISVVHGIHEWAKISVGKLYLDLNFKIRLTMKAYLQPLFLLILFSVDSLAQAPAWQWATSPTGTDDIETHCVATDANGNVFCTGWYYGTTATFGSTTLNYSSDGDAFLVKYDAAGNALWAHESGGQGFGDPHGIAVDAAGSVYISGVFDGTSMTIGTTTLINTDSMFTDMFIAKFDSSGNFLWAKSSGGSLRDYGEAVTVDYAGNIYWTGSFESATISFDGVTLTNISATNEDIFLAKYDPNGNVLWAKNGGGTSQEWATTVTTDPFGNVLIAGPYDSDTLSFDGIYVVKPPSTAGYEEMFVAKFDSSGSALWIKLITGNNYFNELYGISTDAFGNFFVIGTSNADSIFFDAITATNPTGGYFDMLLAKYDSAGNPLWGKKLGGYGTDYGYGVVTDASGNAYINGYFDSDTIYFDTTNYVVANPNYVSDMFTVKYDASGNVLWVKSTGGIYQPASYGIPLTGIASDGSGNIFSAGCFQYDSLAFDNDTLLLNGNSTNMFVAKFNDAGTCSAAFGLFPDSTTQHLYWALNEASGNGPLTYHWEWGDGNSDNIPYPDHTYASGGFYPICLTITDSTGCTNTVCHTTQLFRTSGEANTNSIIQVNVVASLPVNVLQQNSIQEIQLYPNPTNGQLTVSFQGYEEGDVEILNTLGTKIFSAKINRDQKPVMTIDLSKEPAGIYLVIIHQTFGVSVRKLMVN